MLFNVLDKPYSTQKIECYWLIASIGAWVPEWTI